MTTVSLLVPAFTFKEKERNIRGLCAEFFSFQDDTNYELYELVPLRDFNDLGKKEIAIKPMASDISMRVIENLLEENNHLRVQKDKCKEALHYMSQEIMKMSSLNATSLNKESDDKDVKRAKKLKHLEDDNKRLRQLLKTQLENSEKMRLETQTTVETLKEEFDLLVKVNLNQKWREKLWSRASDPKRELSNIPKSKSQENTASPHLSNNTPNLNDSEQNLGQNMKDFQALPDDILDESENKKESEK